MIKTFLLVSLLIGNSVGAVSKNPADRDLLLKLRQAKTTDNTEIKKFLEKTLKADPENGKLTLLMVACALGDLNSVNYLTNNSVIESDNEALVNVSGLKDILINRDIEIKEQEKAYLRYQSESGYTALTFAVVAGNYEVVKYLLEFSENDFKTRLTKEFKKLSSTQNIDPESEAEIRAKELVAEYVNKLDYSEWNSVAYAASFTPFGLTKDKISDRVNIMNLLVANGAINITVTVNEGPRDLIGLASRAGNYYIIEYFKELYRITSQNEFFKYTIEQKVGTKEEIKNSITLSIADIKLITEKKQDNLSYYEQTLKILNEWLLNL